uniref:LYR motif containing domain-containing protein n=1 Tax=Quercus lobata TaxID=97700 RepID=A0A7N2LSE8_QUELO
MAKGLIWATAEDLARNRGRVLSLYRQILRSINSPNLPLTFAARLAKKAEVRAIFLLASEETSLHNIEDLIDTAEYSLSLLRKDLRFPSLLVVATEARTIMVVVEENYRSTMTKADPLKLNAKSILGSII